MNRLLSKKMEDSPEMIRERQLLFGAGLGLFGNCRHIWGDASDIVGIVPGYPATLRAYVGMFRSSTA